MQHTPPNPDLDKTLQSLYEAVIEWDKPAIEWLIRNIEYLNVVFQTCHSAGYLLKMDETNESERLVFSMLQHLMPGAVMNANTIFNLPGYSKMCNDAFATGAETALNERDLPIDTDTGLPVDKDEPGDAPGED